MKSSHSNNVTYTIIITRLCGFGRENINFPWRTALLGHKRPVSNNHVCNECRRVAPYPHNHWHQFRKIRWPIDVEMNIIINEVRRFIVNMFQSTPFIVYKRLDLSELKGWVTRSVYLDGRHCEAIIKGHEVKGYHVLEQWE